MMRRHTLRALVTVALSFPAASAAQEALENAPSVGPVTRGALEAKIAELEASSASNDVAIELLELYRQALSVVEVSRMYAARAAGFEEATRTAPEQTRQILEEIEALASADSLEGLDLDPATPREPIERQLMREEAELAAADARRADFDRRLRYQQSRPGAIAERLSDAEYEQGEVSAALVTPPEIEETPRSLRRGVGRWSLDTRR